MRCNLNLKKRQLVLPLLAVIFALCFACVYAEPVAITVSPIKDSTTVDDYAVFSLSIKNEGTQAHTYFLQPKDVRWSIQTDPLTDFTAGMNVGVSAEKTTKLMIKAPSGTAYGQKSVELDVTDDSGVSVGSKVITVTMLKGAVKNDVDMSINMPEKVNPQRPMSLKINMQNNNEKDYGTLTVSTKSALIDKSTQFELKGFDKKTIEFTVELDPATKPQLDELNVTLSKDDTVIKQATFDFEVVESFGPLDTEITTTKSLLKVIDEIVVRNNVGTEKSQIVRIKTTKLDSLLTRTTPAADIMSINGEEYYAWNVTLKPNEYKTLVVTRDFSYVFYSVIVVFVALMIYMFGRSPIKVYKSVKGMKMLNDGLSEVKIIVELKNRGGRQVDNVEVIERLPNLTDILKEAETLHPTKVIKHHNGSIVKWEIASLDPHEERIITYKIKSRLSILGGLKLQPTLVRFGAEGKKEEAVSNKVGVVAEVIVREDEM